jgi:Mg2+-importing ATPase
MGDGINDAPALRAADVGISVANATDVAKDSADIVLVTKNLSTLIQGVEEGRRTFVNTMKYIQMATSSNFGNMLSMTGASIVLPFLPMLPAQILLNNLIYDASQLSLIKDSVDKEVLDKPNPWDIKMIKKFMIYFGLASSIFDFLTFFVLFKVFHLTNSAFQTGWFLESFLTQTFVIFFIRSSKSILKSTPPNIFLTVSMFGAVALAWSIALSKFGALFDFTPLPLPILLVIVLLTLVYFATVETVKYFFYKKA